MEKLPGTGWHKNHWFCPRHHAHLVWVREQAREQNAVYDTASRLRSWRI